MEDIPGVGRALAGKIREILETGTCRYLEELRKKVPSGLRALLSIPGVGAKTAAALYNELGVRDVKGLEVALSRGLVRSLPKMGPKREMEIQRGLEQLKAMSKKAPLGVALPFAEELVRWLRGRPFVQAADVAGDVRRFLPLVEEIVIACASTQPEAVTGEFLRSAYVRDVLYNTGRACEVETTRGCLAKLVVVEPETYPVALNRLTGSKMHNLELERIASEHGLRFEGFQLKRADNGEPRLIPSEERLYEELGLPFICPELREGTGELEAALRAELPELVELNDMRGDLHVHTSWSDGTASIEVLAKAARELGYEYIAVTDHSKSLAVAGGLNEEKIRDQSGLIGRLNLQFSDFRILTGVEVDILKDGSLDLGDEILRELDVVIASIHTGFKAEKADNTERLLSAMKNENVDIIAHPTGRMIGYRAGYEIDLDRVLDYARRTHTVLEINASPDRLDLDYLAARTAAKEYGVRVAINTDAHSPATLRDMRYGIGTARKAWLSKEDIVNTRSVPELLGKVLKKGGIS